VGASVQLSVATASSTTDTDITTGTWASTGSACITDSTTGTWNCITEELAPGLHKFRSTATTILDGVTDIQTSTSALVVTIDTTAPTVSLARTGSGTLRSSQTDTITYTLTEAATNFAVGDITVSGGTLSSFTATSSTVYTAIFTPTASTQTGSGSVSVAAGVFTDAAGNSNTASSATTISYDTAAPTMTVAASPSPVSSGATSTITFTASETTSTFTASDISTTLGTLSGFSGSGTTYTATFTASLSTGGTAVVTVASGSFADAQSNTNTTTFTGSLTISNTTSSSGGRTSYLANGTNGTNGTRYFVERFTTAGAATWTAPQESPLLMYWQSAAEAVQATTAVVVVQAAEFRSKQALLSLERSIFRLVQVVPLVQAIQTTARTDQRQRLAQFPLAVETVAVQTAAQAVPQ
jgi:hypothetical protein